MASRLPGGDIIVFHEYFDSVIRSKCGEFLNSPHAQAPLIINSCRLKKRGDGGGRKVGGGGGKEGRGVHSMQMCWYGIIRMSFSSIFLL